VGHVPTQVGIALERSGKDPHGPSCQHCGKSFGPNDAIGMEGVVWIRPKAVGVIDGAPRMHVELQFERDIAAKLLLVATAYEVPPQGVLPELVMRVLRANGLIDAA
jgi:hypothetical protein